MARPGATCSASFPNPPPVRDILLKKCPFCGGSARLRVSNTFLDTGYRVQCSDCATGTAIVNVGKYISFHGESDRTFTDDEAAMEAARMWNGRYEP